MPMPPHDLDAEASVLGAVLLRPSIVRELIGSLDPGDFYKPSHQYIWLAMLQLHDEGAPIDVITLADRLTSAGVIDECGGTPALIELTNAVPSVSTFGRYADIVIDCSRRRHTIHALAEIMEDAYERGTNLDELLGKAETISLTKLIGPRDVEVAGLFALEEFVAKTELEVADSPWLVEHVFKPRWRTILVAGEGIGKAVLMRFLAIHAACGRDPWNPSRFVEKQCKVLYIDVENPAETILHQLKIANRRSSEDLLGEAKDHLFIWHREGGMNLRDRRTMADMESTLQKVQPDIVMAGPMYKLYRRGPKEDMEQAALEFTEILDDFRTRFNFALMLEHHSPKAASGAFRELNPFGSSLFMRWPEIGVTLDFDGAVGPDDTNYTLNIGRFRRDRVVNDWPSQIERNDRYSVAWSPYWARGRGAKLTL